MCHLLPLPEILEQTNVTPDGLKKTTIVITTCLQFGGHCILVINIIWMMADGNSFNWLLIK